MPATVNVYTSAAHGQSMLRRTKQMHVVAAVELGEFAADLAAASGMNIVEASQKVVRDAAVQTLQLAQVYAPSRSGQLRESIRIDYDRGGLSATVAPHAPHAAYVEFGTGLHNELLPPGMRKPYIIEPKKPGGVLRFQVGGTTVFTKRVIHPGIKAQPYMRPAADRVADAFATGIQNAGAKVIVEGSN